MDQKFQNRHNICLKSICGEAKGADQALIEDGRLAIKRVTKDFASEDIYNNDETAKFFRLLPNKTLASKGSNVSGLKQSKDRITIGCCANSNGTDKCKLTIVHKFQRPRCFGKTLGVLL